MAVMGGGVKRKATGFSSVCMMECRSFMGISCHAALASWGRGAPMACRSFSEGGSSARSLWGVARLDFIQLRNFCYLLVGFYDQGPLSLIVQSMPSSPCKKCNGWHVGKCGINTDPLPF